MVRGACNAVFSLASDKRVRGVATHWYRDGRPRDAGDGGGHVPRVWA